MVEHLTFNQVVRGSNHRCFIKQAEIFYKVSAVFITGGYGGIGRRAGFRYQWASRAGSSVGISKVNNISELKNAIKKAGKYDNKILIEEGIIGKEVECAVLGNENVISSCIGEIKAADEFYSYEAKYNNQNSKTLIPAEITDEKSKKIEKRC